MNKFEFKILGKTWTLRVLKKKKYLSKHGADSVAITYTNKRRIDLGPQGLDEETIAHELTHAYYAELCLHSTDMDDDNLEEVFAELVAKRGRELLKKARSLYLLINKEKKVDVVKKQ